MEGDALDRPGALTANAYLGAFGIAECLRAGADVVVTGRVTDASLVVGPAIAHFGWGRDDLDALAGATVVGHILECGAQATGGNYSFFTRTARPRAPARVPARRDRRRRVGRHHQAPRHRRGGHGGDGHRPTAVRDRRARLPRARRGVPVRHHHAAPATARTGSRVEGVRGLPPPPTVKVGVNTLGGFRNAMTFVLCGLDIEEKAALVRDQLTAAVGKDGLTWRLARTDQPDADTEEARQRAAHRAHPGRRRQTRRPGVLAGGGGAGPRLVPGLHVDHATRRRQPVRRVPGRVRAADRGAARRGAARRHPGADRGADAPPRTTPEPAGRDRHAATEP